MFGAISGLTDAIPLEGFSLRRFANAIALLGLISAYLLGSMPTGFLLAKALKGIDIREHGSGNIGATNVFRVVGKGAGITALVIDLLKGVLAVRLMMALIDWMDSATVSSSTSNALANVTPEVANWLCVMAALMVVLGHSKSIWLGFAGGKSAATGLGVLLALVWPVGLGVAAVFGFFLAMSRTVSVGSIAAALSAAIFMVALRQPIPYILLAAAGGFYVVYRHRSNISRLLSGTEPKTFGS
jgi:acyl phosphate:glycerol-3-phosphate acyltransferase